MSQINDEQADAILLRFAKTGTARYGALERLVGYIQELRRKRPQAKA